jgi:hypothetical protein
MLRVSDTADDENRKTCWPIPVAALMHLAFSAGLCMLFCGNEGLDGERKAIRHALDEIKTR